MRRENQDREKNNPHVLLYGSSRAITACLSFFVSVSAEMSAYLLFSPRPFPLAAFYTRANHATQATFLTVRQTHVWKQLLKLDHALIVDESKKASSQIDLLRAVYRPLSFDGSLLITQGPGRRCKQTRCSHWPTASPSKSPT